MKWASAASGLTGVAEALLHFIFVLSPDGYKSSLRTDSGTGPWSALKEFILDEPTWRCHQNPFVGALGIQEPVILGEPQIKG